MTEKAGNIEAIMQSIRGHVLANESAFSAGEPGPKSPGKVLPSEFYEHLHQASRTYDQIYTQLDLGPTNVPIMGGVFQTVRRKLHELVLFYVNQMAAKQINVNQHLLRTVNILAEEIESMQEAGELAKR